MVNLSTSNPRYEDVPLNIPPFEWTSDLSYWDASMGAVSDSSRKMMWLLLAIVPTAVNFVLGSVLTAVLVKPKVRRKPYNIFLIFLMVPDIIFNASVAPVYLVNYLAGKYVAVEVCKFQGFIAVFCAAANCYVNALIALEIHRMLRDSYGRKRYFPPSAWEVTVRCLSSYLIGAVATLIWSLNFENFPARVFLTGGGTFCVPAPYDTNSALLYFLVLGPVILYIPFGICGYVTLDVLRRGLLPEKGEGKRALAMFFFRLLLVFVVFWIPITLSVFVSTNPWFAYVGGLWSHAQGAASAIAMLSKGDIHDCVLDLLDKVSCGLLTCQTEPRGDRFQSNLSNLSNTMSTQGIERVTNEIDNFGEEESEDAENPYLQDDATVDGPESPLPTVFENEPRHAE